MKKAVTLLFALLALAAAGLRAEENPADANPVVLSKTFDFKNFQELAVGNAFQVELVQDSKWSVQIEYSDFLEPYLDVALSGSQLKLTLKNVPQSLQRSRKYNENRVLTAKVHMPRLGKLTVSGAARLDAKGTFEPAGDTFRMDVSGAAVVDGMAVSAPKARLAASGAAKLPSFTGKIPQVDLRLSGAAKGGFDIQADTWKVVLSGSAKATLRGTKCRSVEMECSGSAGASLEVQADKLEYEGSGASSLDAEDAPACEVEMELSGASKARVAAQESLKVEASGASTCRYKAAGRLGTRIINAVRGASVKEI